MHIASNQPQTCYCVGKPEVFRSLSNCLEYLGQDYLYYGEVLTKIPDQDTRLLLLDTNLVNISFCVMNNIKNVQFYHGCHIISEKDKGLLNQLERQYLASGAYIQLKQLNFIRLYFDITEKAVALSSLPLHIQMEHTTFCNARCVMCDHYIAHNRGAKHLTLSAVKAVEALFPYASMIIMHGNGEPLINPDILPIFELYQKYQIVTSLNTNLSYLTEDILSAIRDNCKSIHISCDGSNEKQYESIRLGLSYSGFIHNIKRLTTVCGGTEKVLEVVLMRQNITNAKKFVEFAYDYGFAKVIFNALGYNKWIGNERDGLHNFRPLAIYYCSLAKDEGNRLGIDVVTPFEYILKQEYEIKEECCAISEEYPSCATSQILHNKYPWYTNAIAVEKMDMQSIGKYHQSYDISGVCEYPFAKTYIDLNGNVSFCCPASRRFVDTISAGHKFEEIWNSGPYQRIRETFYSGGMPLLCKNCFLVRNRTLHFLAVN